MLVAKSGENLFGILKEQLEQLSLSGDIIDYWFDAAAKLNRSYTRV